MIATSGSFSYIRPDSKGKPYTIRVSFTAMPQSYEASDVISVRVQEIDEESGFQEIYDYYIRETDHEYTIGIIKNQRFVPVKSEILEELKERVLARYKEIGRN
jgi:hypothetical protein